MKIEVLDRTSAEAISKSIEKKYVYYISITDPDKKMANLYGNEKNILRLNFYDIETQVKDLEDKIFDPMQEEDALRVAEFINKNKEDIELLIVHCEAGISRSAGVAAALSKFLSGDDMYYFTCGRFRPNMTCYRKTLNALMGDDYDD
jgi:predicted protein tyrosine phosphatase